MSYGPKEPFKCYDSQMGCVQTSDREILANVILGRFLRRGQCHERNIWAVYKIEFHSLGVIGPFIILETTLVDVYIP